VRGPHRLIVIQRTRRDLLRRILQESERWPAGTAVVLDRRGADRRVTDRSIEAERRRGSRRAAPDPMWQTDGFIIVETAVLPKEAVLLSAARQPVGPEVGPELDVAI
jgi:hypothetical protein